MKTILLCLFGLSFLLANTSAIGEVFCEETCQHFDRFEQRCLYQTQCIKSANCMTEIKCERFDSFDRRCMSE
jgi:hypothetical protein